MITGYWIHPFAFTRRNAGRISQQPRSRTDNAPPSLETPTLLLTPCIKSRVDIKRCRQQAVASRRGLARVYHGESGAQGAQKPSISRGGGARGGLHSRAAVPPGLNGGLRHAQYNMLSITGGREIKGAPATGSLTPSLPVADRRRAPGPKSQDGAAGAATLALLLEPLPDQRRALARALAGTHRRRDVAPLHC